MLARAGKYKFGARAGKYKFGARAGVPGKYKYPVSEKYPLAVYTQCGNICYFFWERVNQRWSTSNAITEMINDIGF